MKILSVILLYTAITIAVFQNWLWFAALLILVFSLRFGAVTLIPLAILIDGYFGNFYGLPHLSLMAICWYVFIEYIRPRILDLNVVRN